MVYFIYLDNRKINLSTIISNTNYICNILSTNSNIHAVLCISLFSEMWLEFVRIIDTRASVSLYTITTSFI